MGRTTRWLTGAVAALGLLVASLFLLDRSTGPQTAAVELAPLTIPAGDPLPETDVLFDIDDGQTTQVARLRSDGTIETLTDDPTQHSFRPQLSPDRRTVLFYRVPADADVVAAGPTRSATAAASLWMMAIGAEPVEVLPVGAHGWTSHRGAEWSPTGGELAMIATTLDEPALWITSADGRDIRRLVASGEPSTPAWSPDGRRVLFSACVELSCDRSPRELFAALVDSGETMQLTNDGVDDDAPAMSPDGTRIAMRSLLTPAADGVPATWAIRVVPTDRSRPPQSLVQVQGQVGDPRWRSDEDIVFHLVPAGADAGVYQLTVPPASGSVVEPSLPTALADRPGRDEANPDP